MPRRKIGADLKEALCKLYEAGDISADTIEKHGIMSRATFFRNLKMYKTGASLEQRHSTGRKTNADKLKEQEKQELDSLQPARLSHLELVLLLDDEERSAQSLAARTKRKAKGSASSSKRRETGKGTTSEGHAIEAGIAGDESGSESDGDFDEDASLASRQALDRLTQAARSFLVPSSGNAASETSGFTDSADLDSLLKPEDSHYSLSNRGALYIVRQKMQSNGQDGSGEIVAAIALRSLIWTPQIYQALGPSYASRSIDKICNLARLRVDPMWQRKGIGHWLVNAAELKASKLGFSHLYTQSEAHRAELLSFWERTGFTEFARVNNVARLEKVVSPPTATPKSAASKRAARSPPTSTPLSTAHTASSSTHGRMPGVSAVQEDVHEGSTAIRPHIEAGPSAAGQKDSAPINPLAPEIDPAIPLDLPSSLPTSSTPTGGAMLPSTHTMSVTSRPAQKISEIQPQVGQVPSTTAAPAAIAPDHSADPSFTPAFIASTSTSVPALLPQTSPDVPHIPTEPPPRRIAFHEADAGSVTNRSAP